MKYLSHWQSPLGGMTLASDGEALTGLWFDGQKYFPVQLTGEEKDLALFRQVRAWLESYFRKENPPVDFPLNAEGSPFSHSVWEILRQIPYGSTMTYGQIARILQAQSGKPVSAQAVGGAVGHNPISVVIPCHRVIGADGGLTGYAGGIEKKCALLNLEGVTVR